MQQVSRVHLGGVRDSWLAVLVVRQHVVVVLIGPHALLAQQALRPALRDGLQAAKGQRE